MSNEITPGAKTTEYARAESASYWGIVGMILGAVITTAPPLVERIFGGEPDGTAYVVSGAIVAGLSILYKAFVDIGYIKSRTDVKVARELANGEK